MTNQEQPKPAPIQIHEDKHPGLVMGAAVLTEVQTLDQHYWKAVEPIGSLFGSEVQGEIEAYGRTREQALANLEVERNKLYELLWV